MSTMIGIKPPWPAPAPPPLRRAGADPTPAPDALSHAWKSGYAQAKEEDRMSRDFCPHCNPCVHDGGDKCRSPAPDAVPKRTEATLIGGVTYGPQTTPPAPDELVARLYQADAERIAELERDFAQCNAELKATQNGLAERIKASRSFEFVAQLADDRDEWKKQHELLLGVKDADNRALVARAERAEAEVRRLIATMMLMRGQANDDETELRRLREVVAAAEDDAKVWRHIAQERYADFRRQVDPSETGYAIEGALDSLFRNYRKGGKYKAVFCSQCGGEFGPDYHGYSHCADHIAINAARGKMERT